MASFARGEADVAVATTVIEVGVDVPNATPMVIEDAGPVRPEPAAPAPRPGRPGQGKKLLHPHHPQPQSGDAQRLKALCKTADGFKIAEEDLRLRGPGDFFGPGSPACPHSGWRTLAATLPP